MRVFKLFFFGHDVFPTRQVPFPPH